MFCHINYGLREVHAAGWGENAGADLFVRSCGRAAATLLPRMDVVIVVHMGHKFSPVYLPSNTFVPITLIRT